MSNYFCAKISQEHSEEVRSLALKLGVPKENIIFSAIGCQFCTLGVYIKFEKESTLELFSNESAPYVLERW